MMWVGISRLHAAPLKLADNSQQFFHCENILQIAARSASAGAGSKLVAMRSTPAAVFKMVCVCAFEH